MRLSTSKSLSLEEQLERDMADFSLDPLGFVLYAFPWGDGELAGHDGPDIWQREQLLRIGKRLRAGASVGSIIQESIASGHGIGKSAEVGWLILWAMATCEDTKGVVTANTETQLKTKTWAELGKWHRLFIAKHWFNLTATALISTQSGHELTWRIDQVPWSESNTEAFAGLHNQGKRILLIFDEGSAIPDKIWEVAEGALTDRKTQILWLVYGNPTRNTGRFRDCFSRYKHRWVIRQIDSRDCKYTNKEQIEKWIEDYGINSDFVKVRVRGMFPAMSAKQFISVEDVDTAFGKVLREESFNFAPKILCVDPAWTGTDVMVIGLRQGLQFTILRTLPKNDNDVQMATLIANLEDQHQADAVFVDAGYGTGIVSAGRTMGRDHWQLVWFSAASPDKGCRNLRAYMWREMRDWLKEGGAIPKNQALYDGLIGPETIATLDGVIQLEPKEAMKKRGLPSPGEADCLAISFAFPVQSKHARFGKAEQARTQSKAPLFWRGGR